MTQIQRYTATTEGMHRTVDGDYVLYKNIKSLVDKLHAAEELISQLEADHRSLVFKLERMTKAENDVSAAYVRIRSLVGTDKLDPPVASFENITKQTEAAVKALVDTPAQPGGHKKHPLRSVDIPVLVESGIDCEFSDKGHARWVIDQLGKTVNSIFHAFSTGHPYRRCRPRIGHWYSWSGGKCPLPEGFVGDIRTRDGDLLRNIHLYDYVWSHDGDDRDIIAFKIVGLSDRFCMPWEVSGEKETN